MTRIVSLTPGATDVVAALGLADRLAGVGHECGIPPGAGVGGVAPVRLTRSTIGDGRSLTGREIDEATRAKAEAGEPLFAIDAEALRALEPDLILTQGLCGVCAAGTSEVERALAGLADGDRPRVLSLDGSTLEGVLADFARVAEAAGVPERGAALVGELRDRFAAVAARAARASGGRSRRPRVVFLEWLEPPFSAGHWTPELIELAGGVELLGEAGGRSRALEWGEIAAANPDALFVACCGWPAERTAADAARPETSAEWRAIPAARAGRVHIFDGDAAFNRPGPRMIEGLEALAEALANLDPEAT